MGVVERERDEAERQPYVSAGVASISDWVVSWSQ